MSVGCVWFTSKLMGPLVVAAALLDAAVVLDDVEEATGTGAPDLLPGPERLGVGGDVVVAGSLHDLAVDALAVAEASQPQSRSTSHDMECPCFCPRWKKNITMFSGAKNVIYAA
ncbi:hypothetical protein K438DRAFT_1995987 [Mycena galopus ATCC 62051]|nr:hypothetical protein K438DRAFT_1995987 [Mycena galopus ATCC 62051]